MDYFRIGSMLLGLVVIFLFAIKKFSGQVERLEGDHFRQLITRLTSTPLRGTLLGTVITGIIQSSTATTVLVVGLVNAHALSFYNSLGVIIGANIGSTITSQLVAFKIITIAPLILFLGMLMGSFESRFKRYGKMVFYFGLSFTCLAFMAWITEPLAAEPVIVNLLSKIDSLTLALTVGFIATALLQSSGIVSGIIILLVSQGLIDFNQAFGMILGANIGTTITAVLASLVLDKASKRAAIAHVLFNIIGVIIFIPFIDQFSHLIRTIDGSVAREVANAHLMFNVISAVLFLIFIKPFARLVEKIVP